MSDGSDCAYSAHTPCSAVQDYIAPMRNLGLVKADGIGLMSTTHGSVNYNSFLSSYYDSGARQPNRGKFVSKSLGGRNQFQLLPLPACVQDRRLNSKHYTTLNKIKEKLTKDKLHRVPNYKQLNKNMQETGERYMSMGAKAKREEVAMRMSQTSRLSGAFKSCVNPPSSKNVSGFSVGGTHTRDVTKRVLSSHLNNSHRTNNQNINYSEETERKFEQSQLSSAIHNPISIDESNSPDVTSFKKDASGAKIGKYRGSLPSIENTLASFDRESKNTKKGGNQAHLMKNDKAGIYDSMTSAVDFKVDFKGSQNIKQNNLSSSLTEPPTAFNGQNRMPNINDAVRNGMDSFLNGPLDFAQSMDSTDSVKPRQYYYLWKEPYLKRTTPMPNVMKREVVEEWKATKEDAKKWQIDLEPIKEMTMEKKRSYKAGIKTEKLILALFNKRKDKSQMKQAVDTLKNDQNLKQMVENDPLFKSQLKNAPTETIYTINKLFIDIDQQYKLKPKEVKKLTQQEKMTKFKAKFSQIVSNEATNLQAFKNTSLQEHEINMIEELGQAKIVIPEKKQKKRIMYCEDSDDDRLKAPVVGLGNKSTQKIRKMIQKHFMTGFQWSIAQEKVINFDFVVIQKFGNWKRGMENSLESSTLGQAYLGLRQNMFGIGYLERMQRIVGKDKAIVKGDLDEIFENNKAKSQNMEKLFYNQTTKETFYDQIKGRNPDKLTKKEAAVQSYFDQLQKIPSMIPKPSFLKIEDNWIKLTEETIPDVQAQILKQYFEKTKDFPDKIVKHLMTDSCYMSDNSFATLLQGILAQKDENDGPQLQTLIFTNGKLGQSSAKVITELMPGVRELSINNIQGNLNKNIARNIIESIIEKGPKLQKIRLSAINMNDEKTIQLLCKVLQIYQGELNSLNFSSASLTPRYLSMISEELKKAPFWIKRLDLSYNTLNFVPGSADFEHSKKFVQDMCLFFELTDLLNHVDMSGMNFNSRSLIQICEKMATCPNLMAIHLNDYQLLDLRNEDLLKELLCIFKLEESESICRGKAVMKDLNNDKAIKEMLSHNHQEQEKENEEKQQNLVEMFKLSLKMNILKELQKKELQMHNQLNIEKLQEEKKGLVQIQAIQQRNKLMLETIAETERAYKIERDVENKGHNDEQKEAILTQKNYKNRLMMVKQNTLIKQNKIEMKSKAGQGIGRDHGNQFDAFVLTRKVNNPELIWNQKPSLDSNPRTRFFQVDAAHNWELSQKNECFICDGHKYTIIFFQQGQLTQYNKGLYEIKDPQVIASLGNHYKYNYSKGHVYTPIIFGSVVGGNDHQFPFQKMSFERKLRMMRIEMYSTLMITNSMNFIKNTLDSQDIKAGIVEFSNKDKIAALKATTILPKISDWQEIIYDKCLDNQLTDIHVENATPQDFDGFSDSGKNNSNMFVYAHYLPPGVHKFVIYCPISKRAFCKTMVVDVNTKDQWPEYPTQFQKPRRKLIMNVWRKSRKQEKAFQTFVCSQDIDHDLFDLSLIIKDQQAINVVKDMVRTNWLIFYLNFIEKMITEEGLESYPEMNYQNAMSYANSELNDAFSKVPLIVEQMEIQFIRCVRNQEVNKLNGKLRRFEFIEYFIRIGKSSFPTMAPSLSLLIYISLFLKPIANNSTFLHERDLIKANMPLNKTLHENRGGLQLIFDKLRGNEEMVHKDKIASYTYELTKTRYEFTKLELHALFIYSLEIIIDEVKDAKKYWYLTHWEFIEYICRVALKLFEHVKDEKQGRMEYKVNKLIRIMYEAEDILDPVKAKLRSPDEDISFQEINEDEECC